MKYYIVDSECEFCKCKTSFYSFEDIVPWCSEECYYVYVEEYRNSKIKKRDENINIILDLSQ